MENLDSLKGRLSSDGETPSSVIRSSIVSLENQIKEDDAKRTDTIKIIAEIKVRLEKIEKDRAEFEKFKTDLNVFDRFMKAVSKKGIPLQIILSQLPVINEEISKILHGVVGFTVELEANPDSNAMDVFINYGDSRRVIELASGMEKMMSSLAIRVALINVSSLTKTNMLIIDEGFGSLDETNIEACSRLLQSLKKWFRNIIIISHVDAIKDAVDNSLEIVKHEKDSKVISE
jgi:exonuclease SbcC